MINRVRWASVAASLDMRSGIATLADAATAELRERILSGELESGARVARPPLGNDGAADGQL